jgi:hypothetical protein
MILPKSLHARQIAATAFAVRTETAGLVNGHALGDGGGTATLPGLVSTHTTAGERC